jgi:hypothetical protein
MSLAGWTDQAKGHTRQIRAYALLLMQCGADVVDINTEPRCLLTYSVKCQQMLVCTRRVAPAFGCGTNTCTQQNTDLLIIDDIYARGTAMPITRFDMTPRDQTLPSMHD